MFARLSSSTICTSHASSCINTDMSGLDFDVNDFIFDASAENFQQLVLDNSVKGPVLVHFWSPKAGPSFRLYPVLEKLVAHYRGRFLLINLNVDENRKIAHEYAITSIPTLKIFINRSVQQSLFGYQNETDLKFLLDQYVASETDSLIQQSLIDYQQGNQETAYRTLGKAALANPANHRIPLTIASLMAEEGRYAEALNLLKSMPQAIQSKHSAKRLIVHCEFAQIAAPVSDVEQLKPFVADNMQELPAVLLLAAWYAAQQQYHAALELFHHILLQDCEFNDSIARLSILKILPLLADDDPALRFYRNTLRKD